MVFAKAPGHMDVLRSVLDVVVAEQAALDRRSNDRDSGTTHAVSEGLLHEG